jgi:hypothetical protein
MGNSQIKGGVETFGNAEKLGLFSSAKRDLIIKIAKAIAEKLDLKKIDIAVKSNNLEDIIEALKTYLPTPAGIDQNKKTISKDKGSQQATCIAMADAINETLGQTIISKAVSPIEMCQQIREYIMALTTGISEELVVAKTDIERSVKNVEAIIRIIDMQYNSFAKILGECDETKGKAADFKVIYTSIKDELNRQMAILKAMLDTVVTPTEAEINKILDANRTLNKLKKIKLGDEHSAEFVARTLSGATMTALVAARVDNALKTLKIKYDEIKNIDVSELEKLLSGKVNELMVLKDETGLLRLRKAIETIRNAYYMFQNKDFEKEIQAVEAKKKGSDECTTTAPSEPITGGAKLDKRIELREKTIKLLVSAFNKQMHTLIQRILIASRMFAKSVSAGQVPLTEELRKFIKSLELLPDLEKRHTYFSISGLYTDVKSRQDREYFITQAKYVITSIDSIKGSFRGAEYLKEIKMVFEKIIELIEIYVKKFAEGFGPLSTWEEFRKQSKLGADEMGFEDKTVHKMKSGIKTKDGKEEFPDYEEKLQDATDEMIGGDVDQAQMSRVAYDLKEAINTILYHYRTTMIRQNLMVVSKEHEAYGVEYVKLLAKAIADGIDKTTKAKNEYLKLLSGDDEGKKLITEFGSSGYDEKTNADKLKAFTKDTKEFITKMFDTKIALYRTAETIDIYMKEFTDGITKNPDDIRDIKTILDSTEMIAQWFNDESGDVLCKVFDTMPCDDSNLSPLNAISDSKKEDHYYLRVAGSCNLVDITEVQGILKDSPTSWTTAGFQDNKNFPPIPGTTTNSYLLPGNPFQAIPIYNTKKEYKVSTAIEYADKAVKTAVLKNLMAAFVNIGSKFGGKELMKKSTMSAKTILNNLYDYITYSSFALFKRDAKADVTFSYPIESGTDKLGKVTTVTVTGTGIVKNITVGMNTVISSNIIFTKTGQMEKLVNSVMLKPVGMDLTKITGLNDIFAETDWIFVLIIKSMVSKILTTIGTFNMLNRPINQHGLGYFSGLRLILGGADGQTKIIDEAIELYIRLPLLVELTKKIFKFDELKNNSISMIPEISGEFSGLIKIVFDIAKYVTDGNYSESHIRMFIEEINKIAMSRKTMDTRQIFLDYVAEINRRYGMITKEEKDKYKKMVNERYNSDQYKSPEEITDFIIKGIDEEDTYYRPQPSDAYRTTPITSEMPQSEKHKIDPTQLTAVRTLRNNILELFQKVERKMEKQESGDGKELESLKDISLEPLIIAKKEELKHAKTNEDKYYIVSSAISGLSKFMISSLERTYISFHEIIVTGLQTLYKMHNLLKGFNDFVNDRYENVNDVLTGIIDVEGDKFNVEKYNKLKTKYTTLPDIKSTTVKGISAGAGIGVGPINGTTITDNTFLTVLNNGFNNSDKKLRDLTAEYFKFMAIDKKLLFKELFEQLFVYGTTFDKLITMKLDTSKKYTAGTVDKIDIQLNIDHSKLREVIYSMFNKVKTMIEKYRGVLPAETIKKYTDSEKVGSLYWLEKNLIDELIEGRTTTDTTPKTLDSIGKKVQYILEYFSRRFVVDKDRVDEKFTGNVNQGLVPAEFINLGGDLTDIIYMTQTELGKFIPTAANITLINNPQEGFLTLLRNTFGVIVSGINPDKPWAEVFDFYNIYNQTNTKTNTEIKGLIVEFNQLLVMYLNTIYDTTSRKVYLPAINEFATGSFSQAVYGDVNYNDSDTAANAPGIDKVQENVLFKSIALAIKHMLTDKIPKTENLAFVEQTLANIPAFIKEKYRANIPVLIKLFKYLGKRVTFTKEILDSVVFLAGGKTSNEASSQHLITILDKLQIGISAIIKCATTALQDLNDTPKHFELYKDFISDYELANGRKPFMPVSHLTYAYNKTGIDKDFDPLYNPGSPEFKYLYGTRGILNKEQITIDDLPGMKQIVSDHNDSTDKKFNIDPKEVEKYTQELVQLAKYIIDSQFYKDYLTTRVNGPIQIWYNSYIHPTNPPAISDVITYQTSKTLYDVISLTESISQREAREKIVKIMRKGDEFSSDDRETILVRNIIDLNIVPINLHALMREIPLINLYNYSYTYDELTKEMFGIKDHNDIGDDSTDWSTTTKTSVELLGLMLLHPYHAINKELYQTKFARIMRGALGIEGLERPKYLSDQVYNKALFGELVESGDTDEAGPSFTHSDNEGKATVIQQKDTIEIIRVILQKVIPAYVAQLKPSIMVGADTTGIATLTKIDGSVTDEASAIKYLIDQAITSIKTTKQSSVPLSDPYIQLLTSLITILIRRILFGIENIKSFELSEFTRDLDTFIIDLNTFTAVAPIPLGLLIIFPATQPVKTVLSKVLTGGKIPTIITGIKREDLIKELRKIKITKPTKISEAKKANKVFFPDSLHFPSTENKKRKAAKIVVQEVPLTDSKGYNWKPTLQEIGYLRFNTKLTRDIIWIVNIQRMLRLKLSRDLRWYDSKIVSDNSLLAASITETYNNDYSTTVPGYSPNRYY